MSNQVFLNHSYRYLVNPTREVKWHWLSLCFACGAVLSKETGIMALAINVGFGLYRSYTSRLKLRNTFKRLFWTDTLTVKYFFLAQLLFFVNVGSAHDAETNKPFEKMHAHRTFNAHAHAGWESRYFSEGRDALHGKSLWNSSLELGYDHFSGGVWYGRSSNHQYDELQYNFALTQEIDEYSFYAGYTHLLFL